MYETLYDGDTPLKFISPSKTRWLVLSDCIDRIVQQEDALKLHFSLVSTAEHCYSARLLNEMYSDPQNILYMHFLRPILAEIKTVNKYFQLETGDSLGVFRDLDLLYMSTLRRVVKPSALRMNEKRPLELDLQSSAIYLSPNDADLGTTFEQMMERSKLPGNVKDIIYSRCFDFLKELLVQYQMRLPASMEMLRKLELFCPKTVMSTTTTDRPRVKDLPTEFFTCSLDTLERQWRNVASAGFSSDQAVDKFWLEIEAFKDAGGNQCFQDLAQGVIKLLTLPISNAHVERAFSQVALIKDDTRNRMGLPLLTSIMHVRSGLSRTGLTSGTFKPPRRLLGRFNSSMY